jgi:5,10-methylenetetrahydrofolate reductase
LPAWKQQADMLFSQVTFSLDQLLGWRESIDFQGPVYAGVMVVASEAMGRKLSATIPQLAVPAHVLARLEGDRDAGIELACDFIDGIRRSGAFDGVHLVPVSRYREMAQRLERPRAE